MESNNSIKYDHKNSKPIITVIDYNSQLAESSPSSSASSIDIGETVNKKDERLELVKFQKD